MVFQLTAIRRTAAAGGLSLRWMDLTTPFALSTPTPNPSTVFNDRLRKLLRRKPLRK